MSPLGSCLARWLTTFLIVSLAVAASGCGADVMLRGDRSTTVTAPPGKALIVFIGPRRIVTGVYEMWLTDARGRYLGIVESDTWHTVAVDPGEHWIFGWYPGTRMMPATVEPGGVMHAAVEAGRVYYVALSATPGLTVPNAMLVPLSPSHEDWGERQRWLRRRRHMEIVEAAGQVHFDAHGADVRGRIDLLSTFWQRLPPEVQARHTMSAEDGEQL